MPLRDHFHPPVDNVISWESFHAQWPAMIVHTLVRSLPRRFIAVPGVHFGASLEIDVATLELNDPDFHVEENGNGGGVATAVWAPPQPTATIVTDLPSADEFEVRVYDMKRGRKLVTAVEIVSPANKDRPEHRRAFVGKCAALLQNQVSVTIIDLVTTRNFNLYGELLEQIEKSDPFLEPEPPTLYAVACRTTRNQNVWQLESWTHALEIGKPLPTLPLWLADNFALPLELESTYEETCRDLRIPPLFGVAV